jgi:hypothetical protein
MLFVILVTIAVVALAARLEFALRHLDRQVAKLMRDVNPNLEDDWHL